MKHKSFLAAWGAGLLLFSGSAWAQSNACDLLNQGTVNAVDVQAAINMALGVIPCTANIAGPGVCNVVVVQRVINAALGGPCVTGPGGVAHSVTLNWVASTSPNIAGYNVYRGTTSGGPYTLVNSTLVAATTYLDATVQAGVKYYYVATAVDASNNESVQSNEAQAAVPTP